MSTKRFTAAASVVALLVFLAPSAASAAPSGDDVTPENVRSGYSAEELLFNPEIPTGPATTKQQSGTTGRAAAYTITCTPTADTPHISAGAGGVIYKTRVVCKGTGSYPAKATIRVRGGLFWDSARYDGDTSNGVNWQQLRTSDETRTVNVNGLANTFYTPKVGTSGATFRGHYQGTSTVNIVTPTGQVVGRDTSAARFIKP